MDIIFKALSGSRSYGTNLPTSDYDYKGIYKNSFDELLSFGYKEQINTSKDETYYEVRRFLELLSSANPNILELLFTDQKNILVTSKEYELLRKYRKVFLTKKCLNSFGGYAVAQIKKAKGLNKKINYEKDKIARKDILDFCYVLNNDSFGTLPFKDYLKKENKLQEYCGLVKLMHFKDCYSLFYDYLGEMKSSNPRFKGAAYGFKGVTGENSNDVRLSDIPKYAVRETILYFNKDGYSMHCKDYNEYQVWLKNRNTQRFIDVKTHNQKIDGKNILHCRRLLDMAIEIATTGNLSVYRPNKDYLLKIRSGLVSLDEIIKNAENDLKKLNELFVKSNLPNEVDRDFLNDLLLQIRKIKKD